MGNVCSDKHTQLIVTKGCRTTKIQKPPTISRGPTWKCDAWNARVKYLNYIYNRHFNRLHQRLILVYNVPPNELQVQAHLTAHSHTHSHRHRRKTHSHRQTGAHAHWKLIQLRRSLAPFTTLTQSSKKPQNTWTNNINKVFRNTSTNYHDFIIIAHLNMIFFPI